MLVNTCDTWNIYTYTLICISVLRKLLFTFLEFRDYKTLGDYETNDSAANFFSTRSLIDL